jgi:hypothetical protein
MGKHRKVSSTCMKAAALGAAAVTTTALTVAVVPETEAEQSRAELLRLLADIRPFGTNPQAIPDLTGGFGPAGYTLSQDAAAQLFSLAPAANEDPDIPGVNIITTGPLFGLLSLFGIDYGRVPALPSSIADEIEGTPFVTANFPGIGSFLTPVQEAAVRAALTPILLAAGVPLRDVGARINEILGPIDDIANVRVTPVIGVGLGAFAAGQAYQQVADDWATQPDPDGNPLLGSVTVLPMVLVLNPGRANGGLLARAYPVFRLFGVDTVTPETHVQSNGGTPLGDTGLAAGGNNLIPIKLDLGIQNFPASDFAAWPNPVTLANNGAALLFPTYIIRGFDEDAVEDSLEDQLEAQLPNIDQDGQPLAFNFYLTVPINGAPVLEPTYLAVDALNLVTGGSFNNPIGTALNPVLESAGNLGYTDVERQKNTSGYYEYVRTFDDTGTPTAFFSFPDVEWEKVPGDLVTLLGVGIRQAIDDGLTGNTDPNVLREILNALGVGGSSNSNGSGLAVPGLTDGVVGNALGSALPSQGAGLQQATSFAAPPVNSPTTGSGQTVQLAQNNSDDATPVAQDEDETTTARKRPVAEIIERLGNSVTTPRPTAAAATGTSRPNALGDAVKQASDGVKKTVDSVNDGVKKAVGDVSKAVTDTAKKMSGAAKPKADSGDAGA